MTRQVREFVRNCQVCLQHKTETVATPCLLRALPILEHAFKEISMDFIEGLPRFEAKDLIFVIVDRLTKYAHFVGLSHPYTAAQVARLFLDHIYKLHGTPAVIVSDRDPTFLSSFWQDLF